MEFEARVVNFYEVRYGVLHEKRAVASRNLGTNSAFA